MSYRSYQTEALVLERRSQGEGNARFRFFTKELGLLFASAQGVRKESSKLRYSLEPFSELFLVLVRGKDSWRVVGASGARQSIMALSVKKRRVLARLFNLAGRISGEEKNEYLFSTLLNGLQFLKETGELKPKELLLFETLAAARILYSLGYFRGETRHQALFSTAGFTEELLFAIQKERSKLVKSVNDSLKESDL